MRSVYHANGRGSHLRLLRRILVVIAVACLSLGSATPTSAKNRMSGLALSFQVGLASTNDLEIDPAAPENETKTGPLFGAGLHWFITDNLMVGGDVLYVSFPEWIGLFTSDEWTIVEYGAHLQLIEGSSASSRMRFYGKAALRLARAKGTRDLLSQTTHVRETGYGPAWEVAVGLLRAKAGSTVGFFAEVAFSRLSAPPEGTENDGEDSVRDDDLTCETFRLRGGLLILLGN
jgi:hypothetical protein